MSVASTYPAAERWLHHIAFATLGMQEEFSALEDRLFGAALAATHIDTPVYVSALPRAGTTVLLELLAQLPEFAYHTYRCMPFVLCPLLWNRISRRFRRPGRSRERAHGDGTPVSYDSPEAFEEIIWKRFWPRHYRTDGIKLWSAHERDTDFEHFLRAHMRKTIFSFKQHPADGGPCRYLAKNNAGIARLGLLSVLFPDGRVVIPFREPRGHVASLLRQHRHFTSLHTSDRFTLDYMNWLGHYEFGASLRPIKFAGQIGMTTNEAAMSVDFWLDYWCNAYAAVLDARCANVVLFDYDGACAAPRAHFERLGLALDLRDRESLVVAANDRLRTPTEHPVDALSDASRALMTRAQTLYQRLCEASA